MFLTHRPHTLLLLASLALGSACDSRVFSSEGRLQMALEEACSADEEAVIDGQEHLADHWERALPAIFAAAAAGQEPDCLAAALAELGPEAAEPLAVRAFGEGPDAELAQAGLVGMGGDGLDAVAKRLDEETSRPAARAQLDRLSVADWAEILGPREGPPPPVLSPRLQVYLQYRAAQLQHPELLRRLLDLTPSSLKSSHLERMASQMEAGRTLLAAGAEAASGDGEARLVELLQADEPDHDEISLLAERLADEALAAGDPDAAAMLFHVAAVSWFHVAHSHQERWDHWMYLARRLLMTGDMSYPMRRDFNDYMEYADHAQYAYLTAKLFLDRDLRAARLALLAVTLRRAGTMGGSSLAVDEGLGESSASEADPDAAGAIAALAGVVTVTAPDATGLGDVTIATTTTLDGAVAAFWRHVLDGELGAVGAPLMAQALLAQPDRELLLPRLLGQDIYCPACAMSAARGLDRTEIEALLGNEQAALRANAYLAAAYLEDDAVRPALQAAFSRETDPRARMSAGIALVLAGDPQGLAPLVEGLLSKDSDHSTHAARLLRAHDEVRLPTETMTRILGSRTWWTRLAGLESLAAGDCDTALVPELVRLLGDDDEDVSEAAEEALSGCGEATLSAIEGKDLQVHRRIRARALADTSDPEAALENLTAMKDDRSSAVRLAVFESEASLRQDKRATLGAAVALLEDDRLAPDILPYLHQQAPAEVIPAVKPLLSARKPPVEAIALLATLGDPEAVDAASTLLREGSTSHKLRLLLLLDGQPVWGLAPALQAMQPDPAPTSAAKLGRVEGMARQALLTLRLREALEG